MIIIPTSILAGCMFPIETMPSFIQKIENFLPQHWLLETIGELQHGNPIKSVYLNMAILLTFALTFAIIAAYRFGRNGELRSYY
jgi:ABC-2 type transport system permease protein